MESHNSRNPQIDEPATGDDEVRYEARDVHLRPLLAAAAGLAALILLALVAMGGLFPLLAVWSGREPVAVPTSTQHSTERQLQQLRQQEEQLLSEYAWVDRQQNIVRIPIAKAMELTVERAEEEKK